MYKIIKKKKPYVIAEIGAKYGSIKKIKKLIIDLKKINADAIKIQTYKAEQLVDTNSYIFPNKKTNQYKFFLKHQLNFQDHKEIIKLCRKLRITWFSTPASFDDIKLLEKFKPKIYKIGSDDLTNIPLIEKIAKTKKQIIISTGMSNQKEIDKAIMTIEKYNKKKICILHCISNYPSTYEQANLNIIKTLKKKFSKHIIGLSDHTNDDLTSIIGVTLGAEIIEKHVCPNNVKNWSDKESSLSINDFSKMIQKVKNIKKVYGKSQRKVFSYEKPWKIKANKSIYAKKYISKNEKLTYENIIIRRPSGKISPEEFNKILNKKVKINIKKNQNLSKSLISN